MNCETKKNEVRNGVKALRVLRVGEVGQPNLGVLDHHRRCNDKRESVLDDILVIEQLRHKKS